MQSKSKRRDGIWQVAGVWRYHFCHKGRRYFKADPQWINRTDAKEARDRRRIAVREGRHSHDQADTNFCAFVQDNFLPWIETNRSAQTYQSYDWRCDVLIKDFGKLDLLDVSEFAIEKFKREEMKRKTRRGETQSPASVNRFLQILSSIFTRAAVSKLISEKHRPPITLLREDNEQT